MGCPACHDGAMTVERSYRPAAGRAWALAFYDPLVKLFGAGSAWRALVEQAGLRPDHRVLDLGCGTGGLSLSIKRRHPSVEVVGIDPDPPALARARRKARRAGLAIRFDRGFGDSLPYPDRSFDRVLSAFVLHHLPAEDKEPTLREVGRVLADGGRLHLLDFGGPQSAAATGFLSRRLHASHGLGDNFGDRIPALLRRAGFPDVQMVADRAMLVGHIAFFRASVSPALRPASAPRS
jgi:ubiquinone/menaquinone biosynthesis C-methylase UbiE